MKDDLPWFKHYNLARNHPKMKALRGQFGPAGYGRFWMLNEIISDAPEARLDLSRKINLLSTAEELGLELPAFEAFLAFLSDPEIDLVNYSDGIVTTDQTQEDYTDVKVSRDRKRSMGKASADKKESAVEKVENSVENSKNSMEKVNRAEQSRIEQNRIEQQASKISLNRRPPATDPEPACLQFDIQELEDRIKSAPFTSSFSAADYEAFAARLSTLSLDLGFVDYCIDRVARDKKTSKPAGLLKAGILKYDDWHKEYRDSMPAPSEPLAPEIEQCECGAQPRCSRRLGEAVCTCGRSWTYDRDFKYWVLDPVENVG